MNLRPTPSVAAAALIALAGGATVIVAGACATEETVLFAEPDKVAGGTGPGGVTTGGMTCTPDPSCTVSFENDVFPILNTEAKCGDPNGCHAATLSGFEFDAADANAVHAELVAYQLDGPDGEAPYIVGCDPAASKLLCNLKLEDGLTNSFGECGVLMPQDDQDVMPTPLTQAQLDTIEAWITCGAPLN